MASIKIPVPSLEVQKEIVKELDSYYKIIDAAKTITENWKPGFEIGENWEWVALSEVADFSSGGTPSKSNPSYWNGEIPWVSPKDMKSNQIFDSEDHISGIAVKDSATKMVPKGTILCVVRSGILKHSLPVAITQRDVSFNQDIQAIQTDINKLLPSFLLCFLTQNQSKILEDGIKSGVTVQSFQSGYLRELKVPLPHINIQKQIVAQIEEEQKLIEANKRLIEIFDHKIQVKIVEIWGE